MLTMAQKRKRNAILSAVIGWILSLIILVPFAVIVVNSFKTTRDSAMMNLEWPRDGWVLSNYAEVLNGRQIVRSFFNSLLIASGCVLVCVVVTAMAMFVIKRRKSKLHRVIFYMFFAGLIAPVNYITVLQVLKALHLNGTYWGTILTYAALGIPFTAFMYYNFIGTIPTEIDEAAIIDGTNISQLFFQVIFPLLKPVTVTVATLTFISAVHAVADNIPAAAAVQLLPDDGADGVQLLGRHAAGMGQDLRGHCAYAHPDSDCVYRNAKAYHCRHDLWSRQGLIFETIL